MEGKEDKVEKKVAEGVKKKAVPEKAPTKGPLGLQVPKVIINTDKITEAEAEAISRQLFEMAKKTEGKETMPSAEYFSRPQATRDEPKRPKFIRQPRKAVPKLLREIPKTMPDEPRHPKEKPMKCAIVGFADTTRGEAPFNDPTWEIWGLNELYMVVPRGDRWFEIHPEHNIKHSFRDPKHWEWLKRCKIPVYMTRRYKDIPTCKVYPIEKYRGLFGRLFSSSIAEMMAMAIMEGFHTIGLWGVDMALKKEYGAQKSAVEFFIGLAVGLGIRVYVPEKSDILKVGFDYGYDDPHPFAVKMKEKSIELQQKLQGARSAEQNAHDGGKKIEGAIELNTYYQDNFVVQMAEEQFKYK
jgi:hypothetical protein